MPCGAESPEACMQGPLGCLQAGEEKVREHFF